MLCTFGFGSQRFFSIYGFCTFLFRDKIKKCTVVATDKIRKLFSRIYEDNILGKLSDERYSRMANEYEAEQKRLISEVEENEKALIELQKQTVDMKMLYQGLI